MISPTHDELLILESLRAHRRKHRQRINKTATSHFQEIPIQLTVGQKISDAVARTVGSWRFIIGQSICIFAWILYNALFGASPWDPYPFILLNLMLSFQAAYTAPVIMMSQNRLSEVDRQQASSDFEINIKAELEIELLHQKIDMLKEKELLALTKAVEALSIKIESYRP
ncbi:DUF1003 domain-containing protein [Polynucleobacter brandtiae]|uniref:Putative membrane protein n=1 Tax=Polynucleobacter brandtiae TaxID=1938816 RepID=A0A2M8VPQ0_9BURK|nr:DUF1003 domain-containing protein [Polynucleobacter brandtiae]PJI79155.1 putative membrane protein [Polynucleobacter brandtiae]